MRPNLLRFSASLGVAHPIARKANKTRGGTGVEVCVPPRASLPPQAICLTGHHSEPGVRAPEWEMRDANDEWHTAKDLRRAHVRLDQPNGSGPAIGGV